MVGEPLPEIFRLRPTRAAKVSEISEATASSSTPSEERVNFHIGNPVQESRLSSAYLRIALGLDVRDAHLRDDDLESLSAALELPDEGRRPLEFLRNVIRSSVPYLPRGGFARTAPTPLALAVINWLEQQQETLTYDPGTTSGRREIIFCSGGIPETVRVLFHALAQYLLHKPARILPWGMTLPGHLLEFQGLEVRPLPDDEHEALAALQRLGTAAQAPSFLLLGKIPSERMRRSLRKLALSAPLFFIEANNAPSHLSLAREAKLVDRVIRFLTPAIFSPDFGALSLVFVLGNAEYLSLLETIHFQLKGTPSASECEFLVYALQRESPPVHVIGPHAGAPAEAPGFGVSGEAAILRKTAVAESLVRDSMEALDNVVLHASEQIEALGNRIDRRIADHRRLLPVDRFAGIAATDLVRELATHPADRRLTADLETSFLSAFVRHHPPYDQSRCTVISGSARTALGLLGFHCGIREVVIPDLSWTYEHCFPSVHAVPLTPEFGLDTEAILRTVQARIDADAGWPASAAVVLNNPHNATGRVFSADDVRQLLGRLLELGVRVIDDLSYENVVPADDLPSIPTLRDHAAELIALGRITAAQARLLITVQSVSKTDCLAGARLAVVEIQDRPLLDRFRELAACISPNVGALLLGYLLYRNSLDVTRAFWRLRNSLFAERMRAVSTALDNFPAERNPYGIAIIPPTGSMYPLMVIRDLPAGLSLEWLATSLARQGIGMIPLSTFARSEKGYQSGRNAFRLTLGGADGAEVLLKKTRRVLIDLNRLISEEAASYRRRTFPLRLPGGAAAPVPARWIDAAAQIHSLVSGRRALPRTEMFEELRDPRTLHDLVDRYLPERLAVYSRRVADRSWLARALVERARADGGRDLQRHLESEFYKDSLERRQSAFQARLFDRTVHPTQRYSMHAEAALDRIIDSIIREAAPPAGAIETAAVELVREYFGLNVAIRSSDEADEVLLDLDAHVSAEVFAELQGTTGSRTLLSFWGDWDGSTRPSGQGHLLVAGVLLENVRRLSRIMNLLVDRRAAHGVSPDLLLEIDRLPRHSRRFTRLLADITLLTHQLERRYRGILPFQAEPGRLRRLGMAIGIAPDPLASLWHHNDRLERKMLELRQQRREALEYYFSLNKRIRKELHRLAPAFRDLLADTPLLRETVLYRDLLQRFVLTPRIHQRMITSEDPFAIDTTVFNLNEVNEIGARYGNPGMVLALQVSMSTKPEALISLDRKMRARREHLLRDHPALDLPPLWLVPLFEGPEAVRGIVPYLQKLWDHALASRRMNQDPRDRFAEIIPEVFVAGSDLSQQVGQPAGAALNREAKLELMRWLGEHGLADRIRMKVGTGEPMQRQGGYFSAVSGVPAFSTAPSATRRFAEHLRESTRTSTAYAVTPMMGLFAGGDLRTLQSAVAEQVRHLPVADFAQFLFHMGDAQHRLHQDVVRACEEMVDSRLRGSRRGVQALERLTVGQRERVYSEFLTIATENFRQILYGRDEDVVGIHIISYFIARTTPSLRDRPTVRPSQGGKEQGNRILERIAETIPLSRYGSLLRAIAHNQSQTAVLGINQLTTGLFRALDAFSRTQVIEGDPQTFIADRILPHLPVYEILHSLRLYQDVGLVHLRAVERAIPAGNSAFLALREDADAMRLYIPLLQQELLRRHGIDIDDFFEGTRFVPALLPTIRPDLAVLLQQDLFNTDPDRLLASAGGMVEPNWAREVAALLALPERISEFRAKAWALLERPVFDRVRSFVELAVALSSISSREGNRELASAQGEFRLPSTVAGFFRAARADDEMTQFLAAAVDYLRAASAGMVEVPAIIVRALQQVEQIAAIEEQALTPGEQDRLRYYLLSIARLAGENG